MATFEPDACSDCGCDPADHEVNGLCTTCSWCTPNMDLLQALIDADPSPGRAAVEFAGQALDVDLLPWQQRVLLGLFDKDDD